MNDKPMFETADQAIRWAIARASYEAYSLSDLALAMAGGARSTDNGLSSMDKQAQAALIILHISRLDKPLQQYVIAYYGWGPMRAIVMDDLRHRMYSRLGVAAPRYGEKKLESELIDRFFDVGRKTARSFRSIAEDFDTYHVNVARRYEVIEQAIAPWNEEMSARLEADFRRAGLVGERVAA